MILKKNFFLITLNCKGDPVENLIKMELNTQKKLGKGGPFCC
jgi:hypothetical protein